MLKPKTLKKKVEGSALASLSRWDMWGELLRAPRLQKSNMKKSKIEFFSRMLWHLQYTPVANKNQHTEGYRSWALTNQVFKIFGWILLVI